MAKPDSTRPSIDQLTQSLLASYAEEPLTRHIDAGVFPDRSRAIALLDRIRDLLFPGYFSGKTLTSGNAQDHTAQLVADVRERLEDLVEQAMAYRQGLEAAQGDAAAKNPDPAAEARGVTDAFFSQIPAIRRVLATDVQSAFAGDPAARNADEVIYTYPGLLAIVTHRVSHALYRLNVPLLPRLMSEHIHQLTGIDIHPGAVIGGSFFIDHGTGVVIGQTTIIGDRVKLYQGVTLGAMSFPRDAEGQLIRDVKRHPTIEDDVTIYANATILGGQTVVGKGCIIGGSVFLTKSVPPGHYVTLKSQELRYRSADAHNRIVIRQDEM